MDTKFIQTEILYRKATLTPAGSKDDDRMVSCSISSDVPYQRWFGKEILSHNPEHVNLERVRAGACPFLADHDTAKIIGKVLSVNLDGNRGKAEIKMGNSELAREIYKDIQDGIRTEISIGYQVNEMALTKDDSDQGKEYTVTNWTLLHVASVAEPADITIGVGRSIEKNTTTVVINNKGEEMENVNLKENQIRDILALGKMHGFESLAIKAIEDGTHVDEFRSIVLNELGKREPESTIVKYGTGEAEQQGFSLSRLIASQIPGSNIDAGKEREISTEVMRQANRKFMGFAVPLGEMQQRSYMQTVVGTDGGYLVQESLMASNFIDILRNQSAVMQLNPKVLNGLVGDVAIPKQSASVTPYFVGEGQEVTESKPQIAQIRMTPRSIAARCTYSRQALLQSSVDLESFIRTDIARTLAIGVDLACLNGTGSNNEPLGILKTTGIGSVTLNAANTPTWANIVDLESEISIDNALAGSLSYVTTSTIAGKMKQTERTSGNGIYILGDNGRLNGYPLTVSNNIPAKYILFGNFADLIIGYWGGLDVVVDPYTESKKGLISITAFLSFDCAVKHPESFAAGYKA